MTFIESNWTYDKLGRVASQIVQQGPGPTQVARQDLAYFGNDDPSTLDDWLGATNHKQFHYTFDLRHQLLGVSESAQGGVFGATYTFGNAGRFRTALETAASLPNSDVKPRSVSYVYGDANDRERVTALTNTIDGTTYASYSCDEAGNQIHRAYAATGESWDFVYDGKDHLRRATKKLNNVVTGTEEYWYDGTGIRIAIVKRDASGNKTEMTWFLNETEAHYDGAGNLIHVYSHLSLGTPVARVDRAGNTTTNLEFQFHGLANNTLAAVDQGGTINASFSYAPFGEIVEATDAGGGLGAGVLAHRRRMNDKYLDELTDLAYYQARLYDKTLIAWTQGDPFYRFAPDAAWTQPLRANLYTFDRNNPLRYLDPDGRDSQTCNENGECQTTTSDVEDADKAVAQDGPIPANAPPEPETSTTDKILLTVAVGVLCEPCGVVVAAGLFAPDNTEGGALLSAGCSGAACNVPRAADGVIEGPQSTIGTSPGTGEWHLPGDVPNDWVIVRGGQSPMPEPGTVFSGSMGPTTDSAAAGVQHGTIRQSTAGTIRDNGGSIDPKPELTRSGTMNGQHVNVQEGGTSSSFGDQTPNPVPKPERIK
jgi:RHS repeat-associated protein